MIFLLRIFATLLGGQLVWLKDFDGDVSLTIADKKPFGTLTAKRWWPFKIRTVVLLEDGTCQRGYGQYVHLWEKA